MCCCLNIPASLHKSGKRVIMKNVQTDQLRILTVDDEDSILALYRQVLAPEKDDSNGFSALGELAGELFGKKDTRISTPSFEIVTCHQGDEAVHAVKQSIVEHQHFAVAFLDVRMPPGPDGVWAAEQIRALDPYIEIVIVTGYSDLHPRDIAPRVSSPHKLLYIQKPFHPQEIYQFASTLGAKWQTEGELRRFQDALAQRIEERTQELSILNAELRHDIAKRKIAEKALLESEERYRMLFENAGDAIFIVEADGAEAGAIVAANQAASDMHGYTVAELQTLHISDLDAPEFADAVPGLVQRMLAGEWINQETTHRKKDGTVFPVEISAGLLELEQHTYILAFDRDITVRKQAEEALRKSEEKYRIVLEAAPDPVVVYDIEGRVTYLNPAFSRVFGWSLHESVGREIDVVPAEKLSEAGEFFTRLNDGATIFGVETCRLTKDANKVDVSISGTGFFDDAGQLQGCIITLQDITGRKKTEQEIKFLAYHDVLTGLPNRKSFYMLLEDELTRSHSRNGKKRRTGAYMWALLFLDLDRFKNVNDTMGHDAGDELLQLMAVRLQSCLRTSDRLFRLGGDEFTIVLNDLTNDTDVAKVVTKIRETVARPCCIKKHELYMSVSIGISVYPDDGDDVETLVKNADLAMYAAKQEQEGYRFFTEEMHRKTLDRMKMESNLRNAIQQKQFALFYQPLLDTNHRIVGMEALIRWFHPELGVINPSEFIPLAEETGAIIAIGKWVLHTACQQAKKWYDMGHAGFYVAINLSARQFKEPDLLETIEQVLEATGLPPICLKLEVTESGIMENPEQAVAKMKVLRAKGIHLSIDDFGTGYSSLSYLKRFPIDTLKIDRSFVIDAETNEDDQEIIKTIIAMARNLGMDTVAEGVETKEQLDFLVRQGCHIIQGYYLGRPMPSEKFEDMFFA